LNNCRGRVLDIGAGAGSHSLLLQANNFQVTALEISPLACRVIEQRGVKNVVNDNIFHYDRDKYDTLLLLMNGIGLCGNIEGLKKLLVHLKTLLNPGGQIIFDSSDIAYLYDDVTPKPNTYYGEVQFQYAFQNIDGEWFNWLYIDQENLKAIAESLNFKVELLYEDENDQYLVKLY
ncbi:MAG: methyltransferase domain-containing protein, partial [Chitinophagaceae bacterium]